MAAESTLASGKAVRVVTHTCATRHEQINTLLLAGHWVLRPEKLRLPQRIRLHF